MLYRYLAADKTGKLTEGEMDAKELAQVLSELAGRELRPVSVNPVKGAGSYFSFGSINLADTVFLTKYLALMLRVGTDLLSAVNILIADFDKPAMKNFLLEVRENLTAGRPFYQAFASYPKAFTSVFVNLVKSAEASGNLQATFEHLSTDLEKEAQLRNHIRAALIYPVIILTAAFGIFIFLTTFALPKIARVFLDAGIKPPFFSRIVFGVGLFVNDHLLSFLGLTIGGVFALVFFFWKTRPGKMFLQTTLSHTPVIKKVYHDIAVQRFAATFSSLMRAGLPIVEAVNITSEVVGVLEFQVALRRVATEGLSKGVSIGDSFRRETVFPRVVTNLIAISEKAGHLDEVLGTISDFYADSVDTSVKTLIGFLEPMLLMGMGLLVGLIAISIIVPIYQLTSQF